MDLEGKENEGRLSLVFLARLSFVSPKFKSANNQSNDHRLHYEAKQRGMILLAYNTELSCMTLSDFAAISLSWKMIVQS
jgi:hypothetical protein